MAIIPLTNSSTTLAPGEVLILHTEDVPLELVNAWRATLDAVVGAGRWLIIPAGSGVIASEVAAVDFSSDPGRFWLLELAAIDVAHLEHQREWSAATFGPGARTAAVVDHITKELAEVLADPTVTEWSVVVDVTDGALRAGHEPADIIAAIKAKQLRNEGRTWPDWRTADPNKAIEHVREAGR